MMSSVACSLPCAKAADTTKATLPATQVLPMKGIIFAVSISGGPNLQAVAPLRNDAPVVF